MAKEGRKISSVVDTVAGVFDTVTLDAFDADKSKKRTKKIERQMKQQEQAAKKKEEEEKKKQQEADRNLYESLRMGNLGLLKPKTEQTIG